jgi:hypothetical protein
MLFLRLVSTDSFTKHGHQYWQRPERQPRCDLLHHIERSVQMIKHNQSRRSSVLTHASFSFHRDIHICSFIFFIDFIITIRILHCLSVCAYRMHRRKEKQGSLILTTTWSRNRNVWALTPKLTSHVYPHSQHRTHRHYRTHHDSCDMRVTRERQSG